MIIWNPWHGSWTSQAAKPSGHKISEGCQHCYMYFLDGKRGIDTSKVYRTENYDGARPCHYEWVKKLSNCYKKTEWVM